MGDIKPEFHIHFNLSFDKLLNLLGFQFLQTLGKKLVVNDFYSHLKLLNYSHKLNSIINSEQLYFQNDTN